VTTRRLLLLGGAAALLGGCDQVSQLLSSAPKYNSIDITGAEYARNFALTDHNGQERTLADFQGKLVAVFFGYTQCPDVCPTALAQLAHVRQQLGPDGEKLQGVFISVDPERDTPEVLKAYMASFDPSFIALRGSPEQTAAVAREFKVYYAKVPGQTPDSYTMDHTAGVYIFDAAGRVRLFARHNVSADALVADLKQLLQAG
jgi:protein SCO1/2